VITEILYCPGVKLGFRILRRTLLISGPDDMIVKANFYIFDISRCRGAFEIVGSGNQQRPAKYGLAPGGRWKLLQY
jgi:hypothetical protein